jgi:hypothetical protein
MNPRWVPMSEKDDDAEKEFAAQVTRMLREPTLITFYIPLSHPLSLPSNSSITFPRSERVPWLHGAIRISEQVPASFDFGDANFVSIMLKRAKEMESFPINQMAAACSLVDDIVGSNALLSQSMETLQTRVEGSVLQATTVLIRPSSRNHNEAISDALERVFEEANKFLTAYRIETQDLAVDLLSRIQCVPLVPYIARTSDFQGDDSFRKGVPGLYSVNDGESLRLEHFKEREDIAFFQTVAQRAYDLHEEDPSVFAYHELFRARRFCFLEGDFRSSIISSFTAIEYFYSTVLNLLHWEMNTPRSTVVQMLEGEGFATRLRTRYHPFLGGNWSSDDPASITAQISTVARVRGQVVHAGNQPDEYEARQILSEAQRLINVLKDRTFTQLHRFGRTNFVILGVEDLKHRGGWTRRMRELIGDPVKARQSILSSYRTWLQEE